MFLLDYGAYIVISAAIIMPLYWILFAIYLPMKERYINWVSSKNWIWVNCIGFAGAIVGILGSFVIVLFIGDTILNYLAFFIVVVGSVIMTSLLYFESFILPGLILPAPHLVNQQSELYKFKAFIRIRVIGGIIFSIGFIVWGIEWLASGKLPLWSSICMMIGAPLFSLVFLSGNLRLLGVLLYSAGLLGVGLKILSAL